MIELRASSVGGPSSSDDESFDLIDNIIAQKIDDEAAKAVADAPIDQQLTQLDDKKEGRTERNDVAAGTDSVQKEQKKRTNLLLTASYYTMILLAFVVIFIAISQKIAFDSIQRVFEEHRAHQVSVEYQLKHLLEVQNNHKRTEQLNAFLETEIIRVKKDNEKLNEKIEAFHRGKRESNEKQLLRTVTLKPDENGYFGFRLSMNKITHVVPGRVADKNGVKEGDEIESVNGIDVRNFSHFELAELLYYRFSKAEMITIVLRNEKDAEKAREEENKLRLDEMEKEMKRWEEALKQKDVEIDRLKKENGASVKLMKETVEEHLAKAATKDSEMNVMKIEKRLNQIKMEVKKKMAKSIDQLKEVIRQHNKQQEKHKSQEKKAHARMVKLTAVDGSFGFAVRKQSVLKVHAGSPAAAAGMKRGDQIVSINDVIVETFTHNKILDMIRDAKIAGSIAMEVRENAMPMKEQESLWNSAS